MFRALCALLLAASSLAYHVTRREFVPLIINGDNADVGEWPHQVHKQRIRKHCTNMIYELNKDHKDAFAIITT